MNGESVQDGLHLVLVAGGLEDVLHGLLVESKTIKELNDARFFRILLYLVVLELTLESLESLNELVD